MAVTQIFPLGHPVKIVSNDIAACEAVWADREALFDVRPLRFSVDVTGGQECAPLEFHPGARGFSVRSGEAGRGCFDAIEGSGELHANEASLGGLLELLVLTALDWTFFVGIHAACVLREGASVLLCGDSGAGKSTLAYGCSQAGWNYVSDNSLHWAAAPHDVLVTGSPEIRLRDGARELFSLGTQPVSIPGTRCAPAGPCVFLARSPGPATLRPHSREEAMEYLAQYDTRPDRAYAEERYRALLSPGVWVMEYEDVWDAVRCLEKFL